jgi:HAD superfamily hydrolase (TIGR01509 family)
MQPVRGAIFDLDGTLVDSRLDFDAIRQELGLPSGQPILEAMRQMTPTQRDRCQQVLDRHERQGADRATLIPGAMQFVQQLQRRQVACGVVTRNSRPMTRQVLSRCGLSVDTVITREDGPFKPDPWAIHHLCSIWDLPVSVVVMIGDYRFDVECGRRAGCRTVLVAGQRAPAELQAWGADFLLPSFDAAEAVEGLISWLGL